MEIALQIEKAHLAQPLLPLAVLSQAADQAAANVVFPDYLRRRARNTLRRQADDLASFAEFLQSVAQRAGQSVDVGYLQEEPEAWRGITVGLVAAWREWLLAQGYSVGTINLRISTIKVYARLAARSGTLDPVRAAMIRDIPMFSHHESPRVDADRQARGQATRVGAKKSEPVWITPEQARMLKDQPDTPQGRRDRLLICLLLDHGLRCGEVALLQVEHVDLKRGLLRFFRPKVHREQKHRLTRDTLAAMKAYLALDQLAPKGPLLLGSRRGGGLGGSMGERAITARVELLGEQVGVVGLSAHDGRHYWATQAADHQTPLDRLQDAGGWSSPAMPLRYIQTAEIANEGIDIETVS